MSSAELQAYLARLYTDGAFRRLFSADFESTLEGYFLTPDEHSRSATSIAPGWSFFARSLKTKRRDRLEDAYPALFALDRATVTALCDRYYDLYPLRPYAAHSDELVQFGRYMEETLLGLDGLPAYASDLVRFARLIHELRAQMNDDEVAPRATARRRSATLADSLTRRRGVMLECFRCNVSQIDAALRLGREPDARQSREHVVYGHGVGNEPVVLRVSAPTATVVDLCDGTRTLAAVIEEIERRHAVTDAESAVRRVVAEMIDRGVLEITSDGL